MERNIKEMPAEIESLGIFGKCTAFALAGGFISLKCLSMQLMSY